MCDKREIKFWNFTNCLKVSRIENEIKFMATKKLKNYCPVTPYLSTNSWTINVLMKCLFFLLKTNLSLQKSLVYKPGDSCINQLVSITHEIYNSFNEDHEVRGVFLDICKPWQSWTTFGTMIYFSN